MARASTQILSRRRAAAPMPQHIQPMLAVLSTLPPDPKPYSFEFKWDGVRAITYFDGRRLRMESRNLLDITPRYPEVHALTKELDKRRVILDGEIVALDKEGRPSFPLLQQRMHVRDSGAVKLLMKSVPVYYIIFDLLYLDNQITMPLPLKQRRELLEGLLLSGPSWRTSPAIEGEGKSMYETAEAHGMEGIVAKKLDSPYEPGRRSPNWLKIKIIQSQEFVVGGWCPEKGDNRSRIGCLLLGYYDKGQLRYAGSVGTGFTDAIHRQLVEKHQKIERPTSPFVDKVPKPNAIFVDPKLVVEVDYRRWPEGGLVQQASYKGLRMDKKASQVVKEERIPASELARASGKAQMR
ncbi:MAG TPA: non-homologous end-joining DNA ligase [Tepidisphaeraceae bacterium]|nr:non-homologous end-joining DNA ligase [Tepidisphaeraceae bacterium]